MELTSSARATSPFRRSPRERVPCDRGLPAQLQHDHVDSERRRDLYVYAARAVGTRADAATECMRAQICMRWAREVCDPTATAACGSCTGLAPLPGFPMSMAVYAARAAVATRNVDVAHRFGARASGRADCRQPGAAFRHRANETAAKAGG